MRYPHIWQAVLGMPWAITSSKLSAIVEALARRERGEDLQPEEIRAMVGAVQQPQAAPPGQRIAVVNVIGVLAQRVSPMQEMSGATSTERIGAAFREALADPDIATIVLNVDSPGGSVAGTPELGDLVARGAQQKRVVAVANSLAASAAYWIASQAEALYVTPSGMVGSIGVILAHEDVSRLLDASGITVSLITAGEHKGELNPFMPLSDEDRAAAQQMCDYFYGLFTQAVAKGRGATAAAVRGGMGQGRVVNASAAVRLGMADGIDTLDGVIARVASGRYRAPKRGAGAILDVIDVGATDAGPIEPEQALPASPPPDAAAAQEVVSASDDTDLRRRRLRLHGVLAR